MTSGERLAFLLTSLGIVAVTTVNVFSRLDEDPEVRAWEPPVWEYSSAVALLVCLILPWWLVRRFPPRREHAWRVLLIHLAGSLAFSAAHVVLFVMFRHVAYAMAGEPYAFDATASGFLYEYRKDLLGYVATVAGFWLLPKLVDKPEPAPSVAPPPSRTYDIRDGARLLRVPVGEIVAATAAGNYVEFVLADGRRPLARSTLAAVELELAADGFLRTHRSWLVNAARVRAIEPAGSGDYTLQLEGGSGAPLSRRYPAALEALRGR